MRSLNLSIRRKPADVRLSCWSAWCEFISSSNGMAWLAKPSKTPYSTVKRCGNLSMLCRTKVRNARCQGAGQGPRLTLESIYVAPRLSTGPTPGRQSVSPARDDRLGSSRRRRAVRITAGGAPQSPHHLPQAGAGWSPTINKPPLSHGHTLVSHVVLLVRSTKSAAYYAIKSAAHMLCDTSAV